MTGEMSLAAAQRELREVFVNGAVGQVVSAAIWVASGAAAQLSGVRAAVLVLVGGGFFIFPLTQAVLRLAGRRAALDPRNPLNSLAMQVAFVAPLMLPVAGAAALHDVNWFYPAVMIVVGAHYLPFVFLYGMRSFAVLAAALMGGGWLLALRGRDAFADGAWLTGAVLLGFAAWAATRYVRERAPA